MDDTKNLCLACMEQLEDPSAPCPSCGASREEQEQQPEGFLRPGTLLGERFLSGRLRYANGEFAEYLGYDMVDQRKVLLREFYPRAFSCRGEDGRSLQVLEGKEEDFEDYAQAFDLLIKKLAAQPVTEAMVPPVGYLREGGTRYGVFQYLETLSFEEFLERSGGPLRWPVAKKLFMPLFTSLSNLHSRGLLHLGIGPGNVLIDSTGRLWLQGFATQALRREGSAIGCELFPGYSAPEQYSATDFVGAFTDVYGCAALLYRALTGIAPPPAMDRLVEDSLVPAAQVDPSIPEAVSDALSAAMVLQADYRTGTIDEFTANLLESVSGNTAVFDADKLAEPARREEEPPKPSPKPRRRKSSTALYLVLAMALTLVLIVGAFTYLWRGGLSELILPTQGGSSSSSQAEEPSASQEEIVRSPSLVGFYIGEVQKNTEYTENFNIQVVSDYNEEYPADVIFQVEPEPGTEMHKGDDLILHVSKGSEMVEMPSLVGSTLEYAMETLTTMGIQYDVIEVDDPDAASGVILRTDKRAGTSIRKYQDRVTLFVKDDNAASQSDEEPVEVEPEED